ncbi:MAG: alpha/beta fold hydrolase [Actinobacteria bacterium]|nr:alpha/beta fold hydrolase [Actinomycetota bacterium]
MTDDVTQRMVELEDGGVLEVHLVNWSTTPDDAPVAVDLHGTPSWGRPAGTTRAAAAARGVRLVAPTRAGYSTSSPAPGRDVAAVAADVAAVLDAVGVGRVVVMGTSGGGPHALATAALLGDRVAAVASIAGVGSYGADGLDFLAGMGQDNIDEFGAALTGEGALRSYLEAQRAGLDGLTPELLAQSWSSLLPPVDVAIVTGSRGRARREHRARARPRDPGLARGRPRLLRRLGLLPRRPALPGLGLAGRRRPHGPRRARRLARAADPRRPRPPAPRRGPPVDRRRQDRRDPRRAAPRPLTHASSSYQPV